MAIFIYGKFFFTVRVFSLIWRYFPEVNTDLVLYVSKAL
jgi:hypothetical protein